MPKYLFIVESPNKCKKLKSFLGEDFNIMATVGHIKHIPRKGLNIDIKNDFKPVYEIIKDRKEVVRSIKLILQFPNVYLIVKHHPRNSRAKRLTRKLINIYPELQNDIDVNLKFIYEGIDSVSLLKWADLIIDVGTSVTWDAIKQVSKERGWI